MTAIDLRSDTVTQPTEAMRRAMAAAEVGDDVFKEDPTVRRLEEKAARVTGKQEALFVCSGTMANLVCQLCHCGRGDEMILGDQSHVFYYEQGGSAAVGGIHHRTVPNLPDGTMDLEAVAAAVRPDDVHFPRSRLVIVENTHNRCSGMPVDAGYMGRLKELAEKNGLAVHVDGARIFNAAAALETTVEELVRDADSVSFCLSKGLGAPAGSLVCADSDFIAEARRVRKVLGGGMRQTGVLAAAGLVALEEMKDRLAEDHANARRLAEALAKAEGLSVDLERVRTNMVYVNIDPRRGPASRFVELLAKRGVLVFATGAEQIRAVTHHPLTGGDMDRAARAFAAAAGDM